MRLRNFSGHKTYGKGRGQKLEVRSQRSEVRGQRSEVRGQKTEDRRQETEDRRQERVGERKGSRIRGFKGSSGSLGIFFQTKRGKGSEKRRGRGFEDLEKRRGRGVKDSRGRVVLLVSFF